ncbi:MAG: hypothetical protein QNK37_20630 [Acidobacteriota bacterium]|nr:hypothetical protein [Acidobacteriota bacterium]
MSDVLDRAGLTGDARANTRGNLHSYYRTRLPEHPEDHVKREGYDDLKAAWTGAQWKTAFGQ